MKTSIITCDICGRKMTNYSIANANYVLSSIKCQSAGINDVCDKCQQEILDFIEELKANSKANEDDGRMTSLLENN